MLRAAFLARAAALAGRCPFGFGKAQVQVPAQQPTAALEDRGLIVKFEVHRNVHAAGARQAVLTIGAGDRAQPLVLLPHPLNHCQVFFCQQAWARTIRT